jgi:hypothetical protein
MTAVLVAAVAALSIAVVANGVLTLRLQAQLDRFRARLEQLERDEVWRLP